MQQRTTSVVGEWSLKGLAAVNVIVAIVIIFGGHFFLGTVLGALAVLQYLAAFMLKVEVRSPVLPIAMVATAISAAFLGRTSHWLAIGSVCCIAVATWAWMMLPRKS